MRPNHSSARSETTLANAKRVTSITP